MLAGFGIEGALDSSKRQAGAALCVTFGRHERPVRAGRVHGISFGRSQPRSLSAAPLARSWATPSKARSLRTPRV